jgi:hypothetical protein
MPELHRVERITKTQAVCAKASFKIESGLKVGTAGTWHSKYGRIASTDDLKTVAQTIRIRRAPEAINRIIVNASNLEAAEAFIDASTKEKTK